MRISDSFAAWQRKAPTKIDRVRLLLSDGNWHSQQELGHAAGHRFSAALWAAHRARSPLHYERRESETDATVVHYRETEAAKCHACTKGPEGSGLTIQRLRARVAELEAELARVRR